jgi:glycine/D-amino acid oxidase-like deaminating enzyme
MHTFKSIAIIGSGISGIAAAAVLQREGHAVTLYERESEPGGVWARTYPGVTLQNIAPHYHISDFPWPFAPDLHPTAAQIRRYLHAAIEHFGLAVQCGCEIVELVEAAPGWLVRGRGPQGPFEQRFDAVLVAVGHYTQPKSAAWQSLPGRALHDGIVDESAIAGPERFAGKTVAVVGLGKTALDLASLAAESGATLVHHVFRTPRWLLPLRLFGVHMSHALFPRFGSIMMTSWVHPTAPERALHRVGFAVRGFWSLLAKLVWSQHLRDAGPLDADARARVERLHPEHELLLDMRSAAAIAPPSYFRHVAAGRIVPQRAELVGFTSTGLRVRGVAGADADREHELAAELIVLALGSGSPTFPFLPPHHRELLERESDGPQLYRHVLDPRIPALAFAGFNHGFMHVPSVEVAALWWSCILRGELELPREADMLATIERVRAWKRERVHFEPTRSCSTSTRFQQYLDLLLLELAFSPYRKSNPLAELFAQYGASDYAGLVDALAQRRSGGPLQLRCLPLDG